MTANENVQVLATRSILIVEDELLLAMDLEMLLEKQGCKVLGPVGTVERALHILATDSPDAVTLDMNLSGDSSAPIAAALRERNIPFIAVTGYTDSQGADPVFHDAPCVRKPYDPAELLRTLGSLFA